MRMTPLEIQSHRFAKRLRGYDAEEVETFLRMVTDDYEDVVRESEVQRERIARLEKRVDELQQHEQLLQHTLINAQSMSEKMRENAEQECNILLGEAEIRAEKILDASHRRAARLAGDIRELKGLRSRVAEALRGCMDLHLGLIESIESDPEHDALLDGMVDGKIAYLSASGASRRSNAEVEVQARPIQAGKSEIA
jgi:cell division initiation protein